MRRSSSSTPSRSRTAPRVRSSRLGGIWRRTRRLPNGPMVPDLAVSAATEIVGRFFGSRVAQSTRLSGWTARPQGTGELTMARLDSKTRLSPPLMHVFRSAHEAKDAKKTIELRNEHGERVLAGLSLRPRQVITEPGLRREVGRDVDNLLNSIALESTIDMTDAPFARNSIVNFGIPDIAHRTIDEAAVD